ncbi:MAG: IS66 family insertion sequence element accessory protein TnpB [Hespellia sp.]|nr:IS66 family insertion sequence element accessory protein TnpB [Hespellia sp.]
MRSVTSSVARNYRLQEWATQIRECQNRIPGTSVKEWCEQHELNVANYYYRLREVRKACLQNISEEPIAQSIVPVPSNLITSRTSSAVEITIGKLQIAVSDATSPELLKMVLQVAADVK